MSLSNILVPNNYNLFANSITTNVNIQTDLPYYFGYLTSTQTIDNDTSVILTPLTDVTTNGGFVQDSGNITVPIDGKYFVSAQITFVGNGTNTGSRIRKIGSVWNSTQVLASYTDAVSNSSLNGYETTCNCSGILNCSAGDIIQLKALQDSGSVMDIDGDTNNGAPFTSITIYFLGL